MARIPFKRVTEAFDEIARARLCGESSGSEHSAAHSADLSDLVNSFIQDDDDIDPSNYDDDDDDQDDEKKLAFDKETADGRSKDLLLLRNLLEYGASSEEKNDVKVMIRSETQLASKLITNSSHSHSHSHPHPHQEGFKRQLMSRLRERGGLDAGLCKSRWKKIGQFPAGDYEYIDMMVKGTRYIVEVNLAAEFTIARPTSHYQSLLDVFPPIYVGEPDDLKQVVKLMCNAVKKSLKNSDMQVPPWRRNGYMLAKWFGSYKRTVKAITKKKEVSLGDELGNRRAVGFETSPAVFHYCRGELVELGRRGNMRLGNLAQVLNGSNCN